MFHFHSHRMARLGAAVLLLAIAVASIHNDAWAQTKKASNTASPRLLIVYPAGAQAGKTVEVTLSGQDLNDAEGLLLSVPGARAEYLQPVAAPKVEPKKGKRRGMAARPNTAVKFKVTLPANATPGIHDLRVVTPGGVSNPRAFVVGDLPEVAEKEPNNDVAQAQKVLLNTAVHGVINTPTDVDYYLFAGKKGQRVMVTCLAASIDSRAQPAVQLYRAGGSLLATGRDYQGTDAVLDATLPADDSYYLRVFAFTYTQGGAEHFYRLSVSTTPWIDAVFPPMVVPGRDNEITVYGRNLPGGKLDPDMLLDGQQMEKLTLKVHAPEDAEALQRLQSTGFIPPRSGGLDGMEFRLHNHDGASNPHLLTFARAPIVLDNGTNDSAANAQEVHLPCEIAGRIEKRRDRDFYKFTAHAGETYIIEAFGDRIGSPLDLYFTLTRPNGKKSEEFDDSPEVLHPQQFYSRTEDPAPLRLDVKKDGTYLLQVSSREADIQAGPRQIYRLRITPPQPDFRLVVMPPSTSTPEGVKVPKNGAQNYTVLAWRQDGFNGEIHLREGLPPGVTCPPQVIGPGLKQASLVLLAAESASSWTGIIQVKGTASIAGREVTREARTASVTWPGPQQQQRPNTPVVSRLDRGLALAVRDEAPFRLFSGEEHLTAAPGSKTNLAIKLTRSGDFKLPVQVTLAGFPPNTIVFNNNRPLTIAPDKSEAQGTLEVKGNVLPGAYTLVLRGLGATAVKGKGRPNASPAAEFPASPVTLAVVRPQVGDIIVNVAKGEWKPGQVNEVTVKIKRKPGVKALLRVSLVLPPGVKGFSAKEATIPDGADTVKFGVRAADKAAPGKYPGLIVRVTAKSGKNQILTQDASFTAIVK